MNYTRKSEKTFQGKHALKVNCLDNKAFRNKKFLKIK